MRLILLLMAILNCISCRQVGHRVGKADEELINFIKGKKKYEVVTSHSLPKYIQSYQHFIPEFLKENKFNPDEYYVETEIHTWTENDSTYCDTSYTRISLNLYHLDHFKLILKDEKDFIKDGVVTYRKGNSGGKNFSLTIDKVRSKINGPYFWK